MKRKYMLLAILMIGFASYSQEDSRVGKVVRTEPDGVVIHEAAGVDRPQDNLTVTTAVREQAPALFDLSIDDLRLRLEQIQGKLNQVKLEDSENAEQIYLYEQQVQEVKNRIIQVSKP
jgi:hypothetical protein